MRIGEDVALGEATVSGLVQSENRERDNMDVQTLMAIFGIAATVSLGLWAIIITVRYGRNVRITYAEDQAIALTDDITQKFPDLRITFRGEPISQNLVLLK